MTPKLDPMDYVLPISLYHKGMEVYAEAFEGESGYGARYQIRIEGASTKRYCSQRDFSTPIEARTAAVESAKRKIDEEMASES